MSNDKLRVSLLSLRLSVFLVMALWTGVKFMAPDQTAMIWENYYKIPGLTPVLAYGAGALQLLIVLGFVAGYKKTFTYGAILAMHTVSTFSCYAQYMDPTADKNILLFTAFPMLAACLTLFLMRDRDTLLTVS